MGTEADCEGVVSTQEVEQFPTVLDIPREARKLSAREMLRYRLNETVYFLVLNNECVYVGETRRLTHRLAMHAKDKDFDCVYCMECKPDTRQAVERELVVRLRPRLNCVLYGAAPRIGGRFPREREPHVASSRGMIRCNVFMPDDLLAELAEASKSTGKSRAQLVRDAIDDYINLTDEQREALFDN